MPRALLVFLIILPLFGQSPADSYATTDDGSQLYFISSLLLRGSTGESLTPKLFKYADRTFSLVAQVPYAPNNNSNFDDLLEPRVSGDGSVVGYVATGGCGNSCDVTTGYQTTLQFPGAAAPLTLPYYCQISRNAHYALCVTAQPLLQQVVIVNLSTMQMSAPQATVCHGKNLITSDGRALAWNQNQLVLFSASGVQQIPETVYWCPVISDDGSVIVYVSSQGLVAYAVATGTTTVIRGPQENGEQTIDGISNDGRMVLQNGTLFHTDGSDFVPLNLYTASGLATANVLSGNGMIAYAGFAMFDATGDVTVFTDPTPTFSIYGATVAGSQVSLQGQNFTDTTAQAVSFPGPASLVGVQVKINGTALPLIYVSPTSVNFQIPWETPIATTTLELVTSTTSQFIQGPAQIFVSAFSPFLESPAITEDFSAVIAQSNPANPGDIVNFYLTGLGPVAPAGTDAVPTPASPLPLLVNAISVSYRSTPLKIFYAGLAPGLIGIYQLTVQTPTEVPQNLNASGPMRVNLGLQQSPPQSIIPFNLVVWMNPNQ